MAEVKNKTCSGCKQVKPESSFFRRLKSADGLHPSCKVCQREGTRQRVALYRKRHPERVAAYLAAWRKENPETLTPEQRERKKELARERRRKDPEKYRAKARAYRAKRPDIYQDNFSNWRKANLEKRAATQAKRLARQRGLVDNWTIADAEKGLAYWNHSCAVCSVPFGLVATLHWDHWIPLSSKHCPGTVPSNMVPLCSKCNFEKSDRDAAVWLALKFSKPEAARIRSSICRYLTQVTQETF